MVKGIVVVVVVVVVVVIVVVVVVVVVGDFRQRRRDSLPLLKSELLSRISAVTTITEDYPAADIIFTKTRVHEFPHNCQNFFLEARCHQEIHIFIKVVDQSTDSQSEFQFS